VSAPTRGVVAIVGAGVAALAAALAVKQAGGVPRLIGGPRGLSHLASGAWDQGSDETVPAALRARWTEAKRLAQRAVLGALGGYRAIPFRDADRPLVATAAGTLRRVLSAERNVLDLAPLPHARTAVVGVSALPLFDARALARALDEDAVRRGDTRRFFAVEAEHARRAHDVLLGTIELARTNEPAAARQRLAVALRRAVAELPCDALLLPPILGAGGEVVTMHLERALGKPVGEVLAARSAQSERLTTKLEQALGVLDPQRLHGDATSLDRGEHHVVVHAGRHHVEARAVVLCTGRELAGGLRGGHLSLLAAEAPRGARVGGRARITSHGAVVSERVLGAGSLLEGLDPAAGVGLGAIAASGWIAGTEAAQLAR
jgi:glycerol-3-phosphate dehydrogenase subunit B